MRLANVSGRGALVVGTEMFDVGRLTNDKLPSDPMLLIEDHWHALVEVESAAVLGDGEPFDANALRSPVPRPRSIFGLVANYPPARLPSPAMPMVFGKFPSAVVGPYDDIVLPDPAKLPMLAEWTVLEAELAVVIGAGGRRVPSEQALSCVAGFTCAQDITERVHEFGPAGSSVGTMDYASLKSLGKSFDTFCPLGPVLVSVDEFADPGDLSLECRLNGRVVQSASTSDMLMGVADLVAFISGFVTLRAGDVILTGTPTPIDGQLPRLVPGDVIETEIADIGVMRNICAGPL